MSSCTICLEGFKQPVSLPCGHIFCTRCIFKTVQAVSPPRNVHLCPGCRAPYNIVPLNPLVIPPHLRPFITPAIRRVYVDSPDSTTGEPPSPIIPENVAQELAKLRTDNQTLQAHCGLWRRRAELHGAATLGLLDFARMVRNQAVSLARERDEFQRQCHHLKRKLDDYGQPSQSNYGAATSAQFPPSVPFDFSCDPQAHWGLPQLSTPSSSPSSSPPYPPPSVEASRLAVAALFDLHSYMQPKNTSPPASSTEGLNLDLGPWSRLPENTPGPSRQTSMPPMPSPSRPSSSSSSSSSSLPPLQVPERSSTRSDGTAASAASHLVLDSQPPAKRARHGHGSAGPATEPSSRRIRRRGRSGSVSVGALARSGSQPHSATESLPVAGSSAGSMLA
ncbi:hypothetical protein DFP72DRAFT_408168 [Ephemerocybe angulata]|uniref:RING-type domain-containing protein n=1 Tax=Ephemerocybe angulata TaxID=980116 RepID=A0A8H6M633_9AGAR|nr:hypothetical protein DFP72DRAFT_408168 [Tulosesus angulatus]